MTVKKPKIRIDIELSDNLTLPRFTAIFRDRCNAIKHQHRINREMSAPRAKHIAMTAVEQVLFVELSEMADIKHR
jgi:hypothetical protein